MHFCKAGGLHCIQQTVLTRLSNIVRGTQNSLQDGRFLKIAPSNHGFTVATIRNINGAMSVSSDGSPVWQFQVECQATGTFNDDKKFDRESLLLPVPAELAFNADNDTLDKLFATDDQHDFLSGQFSTNKDNLHCNLLLGISITIIG